MMPAHSAITRTSPLLWLATTILSLSLTGFTLAEEPKAATEAESAASTEESKSPDGDSGETAVDGKSEKKPALPGLRQPGDDETWELKDESARIPPEEKEALSWYMAGLMAQRRGELQEAAEAFGKSAAAAPDSPTPLKALAMVLFRLGNAEEGMKKAIQAIDLDANDYETRFELAQILAASQRPAGPQESQLMIESALKSKTLDQKSKAFVGIHQFRARLMLAMSRLSAAADSYEVIIQALDRPEDFGLNFRDHQTLLKDRNSGYLTAGRVLMEAGRTEKAIKAFEAIDRIENSRPGEHHLFLARCLFMLDRTSECEASLEKYFQTGQRDQSSLVLLKDLLEATGHRDSLQERLTKLEADAVNSTPVRMFRAKCLIDSGDTDGAAAVYQALLDEKGEVDAYPGLMRVEIARKNPTALIATMNRAVRARIQISEFLPLVDEIVGNENLGNSLIEACLKIRSERPNDLSPSVTYFCASVARELEDWEKEAELLKATVELNPDRVLAIPVLNELGVNQVRREKFSEAAQSFRQLVAIPGLNVEQRLIGLYLLSEAELLSDRPEEALAAIREAIRINPGAPRLHYQLGAILVQAEQYDEAEKTLKMIQSEFAQDTENVLRSQLQLAGMYVLQEKWPEAIAAYQQILEGEKVDPQIKRRCRMSLSNAYVQSGDIGSGEKILEEVYAENPDDPGINNDLGYLYADQGKNLEKAERMIRIAVESQGDNPAYLDSLGWVLFRLGRFAEALEELKKANAVPEYRDSTILEHLSDCYEALNQPEDARKIREEALKVERESVRPKADLIRRLEEKLKTVPSDSEKTPEETK